MLSHRSISVILTPSSVSASLMSNCKVSGSFSRIQSIASWVTFLNCSVTVRVFRDERKEPVATYLFEFAGGWLRYRNDGHFLRHVCRV